MFFLYSMNDWNGLHLDRDLCDPEISSSILQAWTLTTQILQLPILWAFRIVEQNYSDLLGMFVNPWHPKFSGVFLVLIGFLRLIRVDWCICPQLSVPTQGDEYFPPYWQQTTLARHLRIKPGLLKDLEHGQEWRGGSQGTGCSRHSTRKPPSLLSGKRFCPYKPFRPHHHPATPGFSWLMAPSSSSFC